MPWVKLDDHWMDHPKIARAGRDARDMWLASLTWCARHLTDGAFPAEMIPCFAVTAGIDVANCQTLARRLLEVCLWDATDNGYVVHDYLDYNPTKEQSIATSDARKSSGRAGGVAKASKILAKAKQNPSKTPSKNVAKVCPVPVPLNSVSEETERTLSKTRKPNPHYELARAIADVCAMDMGPNEGMLLREASLLAKAALKPSPELLFEHYGTGAWWYVYDFRGKQGEPPSPAAIRKTWGSWQRNGHAEPYCTEEFR
jgi:hypothetical protein